MTERSNALEELRAQRNQLQLTFHKAVKQRDAALAENERLQGDKREENAAKMQWNRRAVAAELQNERLRAALTKARYLAQAARRAMRDHGGAEKFLDLNASVAEFQTAFDALNVL